MEIYGNLRHAAVDDLVECVILLYGFATEELFSSKRFFSRICNHWLTSLTLKNAIISTCVL